MNLYRIINLHQIIFTHYYIHKDGQYCQSGLCYSLEKLPNQYTHEIIPSRKYHYYCDWNIYGAYLTDIYQRGTYAISISPYNIRVLPDCWGQLGYREKHSTALVTKNYGDYPIVLLLWMDLVFYSQWSFSNCDHNGHFLHRSRIRQFALL